MEYIVITPARNEEQFIGHTLKSVLGQSVRPKKWIIVDDGSTDSTANIVAKYEIENDCLQLVRLDSANEVRSGGSKVVRAFHEGCRSVSGVDYDFIVKLDADVSLPANYFEEVIKCFEMYPDVGLCGGYCVIEVDGERVPESYCQDHVRGAFKAYRRNCFEDIGGLKQIWSWDGIDEAAIAFHGWKLKVLPLPVVHHRPTSKEYNLLKHSYRTGREMYKERVDPLSLVIISAVYLLRKPAIIGSLLFMVGYFVSLLRNEEMVIDKDLGDYIRNDRYGKILNKFGILSKHVK